MRCGNLHVAAAGNLRDMRRFSIVLTTCDRPNLLVPGVRAMLETHFDDFELIVSDNFSKQHVDDILADINDKRLRVIRTDRRLPVADHWEWVWEHVGGEFVMYLGDDNALHPDILEFADHAIREHDLDVLSWRACTYFHPDWNITYGPLPNCGNIVGIDAGTTRALYRCDAAEVLRAFCRQLRLSGCFPCMLNFLFRKVDAEAIRQRMGRFFWAPNPDISASYLILGTARPGRYAYYDAIGGIGGRSRHSNLASLLSRGKATQRLDEFVAEHRGQDVFPNHSPKFIAISNGLAATISQAKHAMPDRFGGYQFDPKTLARRTIDDLYVDRTVPWDDDPAFLAAVDAFINSLPTTDAAEVFVYRDECRARLRQQDVQVAASYIRNSHEARPRLLDFWRHAGLASKSNAWRLFRETGRNPLGQHWVSGGTSYVDMTLFGGQDIADAARNLPRLLAHFDHYGDGFAKHHRDIGMLGDTLWSEPASYRDEPGAAALSRRKQ
jgi:glycosyltransferase involved in cell wall biosynthesis